jgi:hypothetical protein
MLAARVEPKNGPKENKKTGKFKPVVFDEYQTGVDIYYRSLQRADIYRGDKELFCRTRSADLRLIGSIEFKKIHV